MPSTRVLASELGPSHNTAALAYEMLLLEGYIENRVGDDTKVARLQPEQLFQNARHVGDRHTTDSSETPPVVLAQRAQLLIKAPSSETFTSLSNTATSVFRIGQPDVALGDVSPSVTLG
ncbi:hypothetical protein KDH_01310 [Dictyobacter sp. S3.2.2.5]|uniref:Uncharacterized protein n=1 Tax=Dictyobacter halimunensis TaxID=3026934 RepID=A0ABQ6FLF0_9CHLR|nr:hypothetical protein KDH_01310 [Dictyobacter sp. S3.2.2.5]